MFHIKPFKLSEMPDGISTLNKLILQKQKIKKELEHKKEELHEQYAAACLILDAYSEKIVESIKLFLLEQEQFSLSDKKSDHELLLVNLKNRALSIIVSNILKQEPFDNQYCNCIYRELSEFLNNEMKSQSKIHLKAIVLQFLMGMDQEKNRIYSILSNIPNQKIRAFLSLFLQKINNQKIEIAKNILEDKEASEFNQAMLQKMNHLDCQNMVLSFFGQLKIKTLDNTFFLKMIQESKNSLEHFPGLLHSLKSLQEMISKEEVNLCFNHGEIKNIVNFKNKEDGANPGYTINTDQNTFTLKQGSTIGKTVAESFSFHFYDLIEKIEKEERKADAKSLNIRKAARAFLVTKEIKSIDAKMDFEAMQNQLKQKLYVASEWSNDSLSIKGCHLFGLEKRILRAGSSQEDMFDRLRKLNLDCDLGLEDIVLFSTVTADFDLHTENFMLNFNTNSVEEKDQKIVEIELKHFNLLISTKIKLEKKELITEDIFSELKLTKKEIEVNDKYFEELTKRIKSLQRKKVEVYFHKIDHDSGFYRFVDANRKVDFNTHKTSPVYVGSSGDMEMQPTLHITELTGGKKNGFDELLLTKRSIRLIAKLNVNRVMENMCQAARIIFAEAKIISQEEGTSQQKKIKEFIILKEYYHHLTKIQLRCDISKIDAELENVLSKILKALSLGSIYKTNDLHEQLYTRLIQKEKEEKILSSDLIEFKTYLIRELYLNRAELLYQLWPEIRTVHKPFSIFGEKITSVESTELKIKIDTIFKDNLDDNGKEMAFKHIIIYLKQHPNKSLAKIIMNKLNVSILSVNDLIFNLVMEKENLSQSVS
jgi:hypothetical protein